VNNRETGPKAAGLLVLILILLTLSTMGEGFSPPASPGFQCVDPFFVQIEGDINFPGVYTFCHQARLRDLVSRAGGLPSHAAPPESLEDSILLSGVRIMVRSTGKECQVFREEMAAFYKVTLGISISLNGESEEGLTAIPGIGTWLAEAIVRERSKRGGFKDLDEMMSIGGIGHRVYGKIRPYLKL